MRKNERSLSIVHINTYDDAGGAAKVAWRLAEGQRIAGCDSRMVVGIKNSDSEHSSAFPIECDPARQPYCKEHGQLFYDYQGSYKLTANPVVKSADILHLHNLHKGYFNPFSLSVLSHLKPLVWTLHDMQSITGYCAHSFDCEKWQTGCGLCPDLTIYPKLQVDTTAQLWNDKKLIYDNSHLFLVAPSQWLKNKIEKSILRNHPVELIYNCCDTNVFRPYDKKQAKRKLGIPENSLVIGSVAQGGALKNRWKGGQYTQEALAALRNKFPDYLFLNIGGDFKTDDPRIISTGQINDENELGQMYSALDIYLYTPLADNCPLVVIETLSCGVPIVTFNTGGVPELVRDGVDGFVTAYKDLAGVVQGLEKLSANPQLRAQFGYNGRQRAISKFDHKIIAEQYFKIYHRCIEEHRTRATDIKLFPLEKVPKIILTETFMNAENSKSNCHVIKNTHKSNLRCQELPNNGDTNRILSTFAKGIVNESPSANNIRHVNWAGAKRAEKTVTKSGDVCFNPKPKLSIVVTSRNDDHGGNGLHRMQVFAKGIAEQCKRFNLNAELIIVEWNPPADRKRLYEILQWPDDLGFLTVRFIEVPPEIHKQISNSDKFPLFQWIAKNVGIRRARGNFVLAANIDILFSDELIQFLASYQLDENCFYRIDRHDVTSKIPENIGIQKQLNFCCNNLIRVQGLYGTKKISQMPSDHFIYSENDPKPHTNACGDFTLMARNKWQLFRGYPELPRGDMFIDGLIVHMAYVSGLHQVILPEPLRIYHIEHEGGWAVKRKSPVRTTLSLDYNKDYLPWCRRMIEQAKPITNNDENWGYAQIEFKEYVISGRWDGQMTDKNATLQDNNRKLFQEWIDTLALTQNRLYYRDQTPESLNMLVELVHSYKPTKIVELGTLSGFSLRAWLSAQSEAEVIAIDLSFKPLFKSQEVLPVELSGVRLLEQDILKTDFRQLWSEEDRVLLYIDAHDQLNTSIMTHILDNALPLLPQGSMVTVDDLWYCPEVLTNDSVSKFFEEVTINEIDPLQCFEGYYAPYWKGGFFVGFREVVPLIEWVNCNNVELILNPGDKTVTFERPVLRKSAGESFDIDAFKRLTGSIRYNPVERISVYGDRNVPGNKMSVALCEQGAQFYACGRIKEAINCFKQATLFKSDINGAFYAQAVCFAREGNFEKAAESLRMEIENEFCHPRAQRLHKDIQQYILRKHKPTSKAQQAMPSGNFTIFALPKAFRGQDAVRQRNAIKSWTLLEPKPEIILFGDEEGTAQLAQEMGLRHIADVECNEFGTPLVNNLFEKGQKAASNDTLVYVNTDIILMNDFPVAVEKTAKQFDEFLMVGQRWDVPISQLIDFTNPEWKKWILQQIAEKGTLHAVTGIDYFVFRKHFWKNIPPFALGRATWDNWLVYNALAEQKPLVDTTKVVIAVHQNHDHAHIFGSQPGKWVGPECRQNRALADPQCTSEGFISSANFALTKEGFVRKNKPKACQKPTDYLGKKLDWQKEQILQEMTKTQPHHKNQKEICMRQKNMPVKDQQFTSPINARSSTDTEAQETKFSFVMIVLNGMPFIEYSLKSVYDFAHEIIIVEGAVENCMFAANPDGSSTDGTVEFIKSFPDRQNKIKLVQGKWPEKCEMQNEALKYVTGNYVWLIDSDEVYKRENLEKIREILQKDPSITQVNFIPDSFWKGLDYIFVSDRFHEEPHHYRRLFKYKPGAVFTSHRPPTMFWPNSSLSTEQMNLIDGLQTRQRGIILYHYSYVLERQVAQKMEYYRRRDLKTDRWSIDRDTWYNECFLRWNEQNRKQIENKYPVWLGDKDSHTEPFKGTHPEVMIEYARTHDRNGGAYPRPPVMQNLIDAIDELKNRFPNEHLEMIETGTIRTFHAAGSSTYSISEALGSQGRLTSVDISPDSIRISKNFCWNAPNIEWIQSDSVTYLAKLKNKKFHFAFLDSVNQKDFIFEEFRLMIPMMLENSILIIDDSGITNDGCSIDNGVPAQKGHEVWCFLKSCGAKFNIFQVPNFPGTQLKIGLGKENLKVIKNKLRQYDEDRFIPESSNLPANTQSGRKLQVEPIIHFVYSGDPYDDNAIRAPRTITNKLFRFLKQRAEVKYYDWADKTSKVDVKLNDIILGHPNPEEGTIIRRLFEKPCAAKYLIWPFHTRIPEINRYAKDVAGVADKLFVISGPHWIETIDQTEYACWEEKIVRLDNAIDAEIFLLLKKNFNPVSKRGLFVFGRTGLEKGTVQLFKLLCKTDYPMVVAGDYSHVDLQIIKNRPNTHILGRIDWRDPQTTTFILNNCDFFVNMSVSDASPTTLLESMALGLIPVTTPQCGYYYDSFLLLSLSQQENNLQILHQAQQLSDDKLRELQAQNRRIIEREHSWEKFCQTVWQNIKPTKKLTSKVGPRQNEEEYVTYNFNDGKNKKRILIVRSDSIGDFVIFGGALPYYRKIYPNSQITIVVSESVAKLAEACPFIDEVITFNRGKILSQPNYAAEFISYVRDKQFDVAICPSFSRDKVSEFIAINSGAVENITCFGDTANLPADIIKANNAH